MREVWFHEAPKRHQTEPADNTSRYVLAQVNLWAAQRQRMACCDSAIGPGCEHMRGLPVDAGVLIHPESAMEIAAWWQGGDDYCVTVFASTGHITPGLVRELKGLIGLWEKDLRRPGPVSGSREETVQNLLALRALLAYVEASDFTPVPKGWD